MAGEESAVEAGASAVTNAASNAASGVANRVASAGKEVASGFFSRLWNGIWSVPGALLHGIIPGAVVAAVCCWVPQLPSMVIGIFSKDAKNRFDNMDVKDRVLAGLTVGGITSAAPELLATVLPFTGNPLIRGVATVGSVMLATKVSLGAFGKDNGSSDPVRPSVPVMASTNAGTQNRVT